MPDSPQKPTILIVEDEVGPRNALKVILRPFYNLQSVDNGHAALRVIKEEPIDLITLDMKLPDRHGMDLLQEIRAERDDVEVIIITGYGSLKSAMDAVRFGAAAYLLKPFNVTELLAVINQTLEKKQRIAKLKQFLNASDALWRTEQDSANSWKQLRELYYQNCSKQKPDLRITADFTDLAPLLAELLEAKDRRLLAHSSRVSFYAGLLGKYLPLTEAERKALAFGAFLHDIGTMALAPLLHHSPILGQQEMEPLKRHPEIGARMLLPLGVPAGISQIILYHHERYDGSGYPYGLQGEGIPLLARVVAIAQAFDHLTTDLSAQSTLLTEEAIKHLREQAGTHFDPKLVELFARAASECTTSLPALAASSKPAVIPDF